MQINTTTDYALRLLLYLAKEGRTVPSQEIAAQMGIPPKYITTIAARLRREGYLQTTQGMGGGYSLTRSPTQITVYDVICAMEGGIKINRCTTCNPDCIFHGDDKCPLHSTYDSFQDLMESAFREITIGDMMIKKGNRGSGANDKS